MVESLTGQLSQRIFEATPNADAINQAKNGLLDYFISSYAGKDDPGVRKLLVLLEMEGGAKVVPLIGQGKHATAGLAALVNGFLGHALDLDDVHTEVRGHPSSVILPVLISIAAAKRMSGQRFLASYCVGVEVMARFGQAISNNHYEKGWHNTSTLGVFAATAAGAYLLGFSPEKIAQALGFAATQSSGLRVHFGTETKPLHAGLAARAAVLALQLTEVDFKDSLTSLDGKMGFFELYEGGDEVEQQLLEGWGEKWRIAKPGLWFKIYPFCSAAYFGVDAAQKLGNLSVEEIEKIELVFSNNSDSALVHKNPANGEEGRFSIEYIISLILNGLPLTLDRFGHTPIPSDIQKLMRKINRSNQIIKPDEKRFTSIEVFLKNGEKRKTISHSPKGSPDNQVTYEDLREKCHSILGNKLKEQKLLEVISSIDGAEDMGAFLAML